MLSSRGKYNYEFYYDTVFYSSHQSYISCSLFLHLPVILRDGRPSQYACVGSLTQTHLRTMEPITKQYSKMTNKCKTSYKKSERLLRKAKKSASWAVRRRVHCASTEWLRQPPTLPQSVTVCRHLHLHIPNEPLFVTAAAVETEIE